MARIIPNNNDNNNDYEVANENEGPLKKGPWTAEEDAILSAYVRRFGEGNWNSVQKNSGLSRCGKSCRLRWANHLRPNLKKGAFSDEEERIIVDLHSKMGNKWSQMATQLPGRTDNEIKNFWNTRMKRRQRASLPIYPLEVLQEAYLYHGQQEQQYFEQQPYQMPPLSVLACLYPHSKLFASNYYSASAPAPAPVVNPPLHNQLLDPTFNNVYNIPSLNLPSPSFSLYGSSSSTSSDVFNNGQSLSFGAAPLGSADSSFDYQYSGSLSFNHGINNNNVESMNIPLHHPLLQSSKSLSQSPPNSSLTPTSSYASGGGVVDGFMGASSNMVGNEYFEVAPFSSSPQGNSGLLDAVVLEGQSLSARNKRPRREDSTTEEEAERTASHKRKSMVVEENNAEGSTSAVPVAVESAALKENTGETTGHSSNETLISSSEKKPIDTDPSFDEISWDDDLSSLLNNFPVEMPMPEWYQREEIQSPGIIETQPHAPPPPSGPGPTNEAFSSGTLTTCWDNMPNICYGYKASGKSNKTYICID